MRQRAWRYLVQLVVLGVALLFVVAIVDGSPRPVKVVGTSMEPDIRSGDVVVIQRQPDYAVGDVVAFRAGNLAGSVVLHRIIGVADGRYVLKGDNNRFIDEYQPTRDEVLGRSVIVVPQARAVVEFLGSPAYFGIAFAVVAAVVGFRLVVAERRRPRSRRRRRAPTVPHATESVNPSNNTDRTIESRHDDPGPATRP